jgi:hypothetical protein
MKNLTAAIFFGLCSLAPVSMAKAPVFDWPEPRVEYNEEDLQRAAQLLQTDARAWLSLTQDLPTLAGRQNLKDDSVRYARLFQLEAIDIGNLVAAGDYAAAYERINESQVIYAGVSRTYRDLSRAFLRDFQLRREIQDEFRSLRTTYFFIGSLLAEAHGE